jgi:hypothetical protein
MAGVATTVGQIQEAFDEIIPNPEDQRLMCSQLLKTINSCLELGSSAWSVSLLDSGFRINVGQVEAMTCFYTHWEPEVFGTPVAYGFLDFRFLISGPHVAKLIEKYPDCVTSASYRSVGEPHWIFYVTLQVEGERDEAERNCTIASMDAVQLAHRHFLVAAAHSPSGALRRRSNFARFHCGAIVEYAHRMTSTQDVSWTGR